MSQTPFKKVSDQVAIQIVYLFDQGHTVRSLAEIYGISRDYALRITLGLAKEKATKWTLKDAMKRNLRLKQNTRVPNQCRKRISNQKGHKARRDAAAELRAESK